MRPAPRKNLRGFVQHFRAIVDRVRREEFPDLGFVQVASGLGGKGNPESTLACWFEFRDDDLGTLRYIELNTYSEWGRKEFLPMDDDDLRMIARHELLHGELRRRGCPSGDNDLPFIMECLRRRIYINESSVEALETFYGRGSYVFFQTFLPPAAVETISLPEGAGVWIREKKEN